MTRAEDFHRLERLERLAHRMDRAFRIPGTKVRFGWDSILGLFPLVGDILDVGYKSNTRNAALLRQEIEQRHYLPMKAA